MSKLVDYNWIVDAILKNSMPYASKDNSSRIRKKREETNVEVTLPKKRGRKPKQHLKEESKRFKPSPLLIPEPEEEEECYPEENLIVQ